MNALRGLKRRLGRVSHLALGAGLTTFVLVLTGLVFTGVLQRLRERKGETVAAVFANTGLLAKGMSVRVKGVEQGLVRKITLNPGGHSTTVEMEVFSDSMPLYRDATASIEFRNALGGNYDVSLTRGTARAGRLRPNTIPESRTTSQVEVDQILASIRSNERAGLRTMVRELPKALRDRNAPARALGTLAHASPSLARGVRAARGEQNGDLRRLVSNASRTVDALNAERGPVRDLVEGGASTLATTAAHRADIRSTIDGAARVLPNVVVTLDRLNTTLGKADPLVARLRAPAVEVAPTVAQLRPTVVEADHLLHDARPLLHSLRPAAKSLAAAARVGRPLLDELSPSLWRLDRHILPDLAKPDPTTHRGTYEMIGPTIAGLDSASSGLDASGHMVSLGLGGGEHAIDTAPCRTYFTDPKSKQVATCESLSQAINQVLSYNPLSTKPGGASP